MDVDFAVNDFQGQLFRVRINVRFQRGHSLCFILNKVYHCLDTKSIFSLRVRVVYFYIKIFVEFTNNTQHTTDGLEEEVLHPYIYIVAHIMRVLNLTP